MLLGAHTCMAAAHTPSVPRRRQEGTGHGGRWAFKTQLPRYWGLECVCVILLYRIITLLEVIADDVLVSFVIFLR